MTPDNSTLIYPPRTLALLATLPTMVIALSALLGWALDRPPLAAWLDGAIPMAPSTAGLFFAIAASLLLAAWQPHDRLWQKPALCAALLALGSSAYALSTMSLDLVAFIDRVVAATSIAGFLPSSIGRMSPLTAMGFFSTGLALLMFGLSDKWRRARWLGDIALVAVFLLGFVGILGYLYRTPLLYGSQMTPIALPTAVLFLLLAVALGAYQPERSRWMPLFFGASSQAILLRAFLPTIALPLLAMGWVETHIDAWISHVNPAVIATLKTVLLTILASLLIADLAKRIGRRFDLAQATLREREQHYRSVTESASDAIVSADDDNRIIGWNAAAERLFGFSEREIVGRSLDEIIPNKFQQHHSLGVRQALQGEPLAIGRVLEVAGRRKDGSEFPLELSLAQWENTQGRHCFTGILRDIAERKLQEERTRHLLTEKETLLSNVMVGIAYVKNHRLVSCNRRFEDLFGYGGGGDGGKLIGQSVAILFATHEAFQAVNERGDATLAAGKNFSEEVQFKHKNGHTFWGALTGNALDPRRPDEGSIWMYADISERVMAEAALRDSRDFYQSIISATQEGFWLVDETDRLLDVNASYVHQSGYSRDELLHMHVADLELKRRHEEVGNHDARLKYRGADLFETVHRRKDGSTWHAEVSCTYRATPRGGQVFAFIRDISKRKHIEMQLKEHKEHLEELVRLRTADLAKALEAAKQGDRAKDAFLANVSHELRTPLNAVIGLSGLARQLSTDAKLSDYMNKIANAGKTLSRIINDLLDLSKIAAGRMELDPATFSLRQVVARSSSVMSFHLSDKGLTYVEEIAADVPDALVGDSLRIEQMLLNLLSNAIKFTPAGQVTLRIALLERAAAEVRLSIEVEDTGVGMRAEDMSRLFTPFSQVDASISRKYGGTGLGLALCKRLAQMMKGDIRVVSREGCGATFQIELWLAVGNSADLPSDERTRNHEAAFIRYHDTHVLVAEDQAMNREIVGELLAAVGIVPHMAFNGREALDALTHAGANAYDLVLMDIQMPIMDGLSATRELRRRPDPGFDKLPIIAMTAHTMAHERQLSAGAGMNDHIGKPFETDNFYRVLSQWIPASKQEKQRDAQKKSAAADLPALRGVDTHAGVQRFADNTERYLHWLGDFVREAPGYIPEIRLALARHQVDLARKTAHAVKGRVGMLGMTELLAVATALENAIKHEKSSTHLLDRLHNSIMSMCEEIETVLGPSKSEAAPPSHAIDTPPPLEQPRAVSRLIELLDSGDGGSVAAIKAAIEELQDTAWTVHLQQALAHARRFNFAQAKEALLGVPPSQDG